MPPGLNTPTIYFDEGREDGLLKEQATGQLRVAEWVWRRIDEGENIKVVPVRTMDNKDGLQQVLQSAL